MKLRVPIFYKIAMPLAVIITAVSIFSTFQLFHDTNQRNQEDLNARLQRTVSNLTSRIDIDALKTIKTAEDANSAAYLEISDQLNQAAVSGGLAWAGIFRKEGNYYYYWVDAGGMGVGYPFFHITPEHLAVYQDKQLHTVTYSDEFGSYYGVVGPIIDEHGEVIGLLEANVYAEGRDYLQEKSLEQNVPFLLGGLLLAIGSSLLITYFVFNRPLRILQSGAFQIANGDLGHKINLKSKDEMGDLARVFNQMSDEIRQLVHERIENERKQREQEVQLLQESEKTLAARVAERTAELEKKNTELEVARDDAEEALIAAEAANRAKSEFLANMSHEIRTPMNAIIGMTGLLMDTSLTNQQRDFAETIRSSGDTLLSIINDILDFSKIEAGRMELEEESFDLRDLVESTLDLIAPRASEKRLDLAYLIDAHVPGHVTSDSTRLRQILLNLLSNAVKFTLQGEVVLKLSATLLDEPQANELPEYELHFAVQDTGIGIPIERMDRLFQSFSQLDASTTRKFGGTGLGLAISRRLVEMMGGKIWVESDAGKGSTFHFTIRCQASGEESQPDGGYHPIYLSHDQPNLRDRRVLVVDDNLTNLQIVRLQTESWGMHVTTLSSASEALELLRSGESFDLAILDMSMPEMDGLDLAEAIRQTEPGKQMPMVMLSSIGSQIDDPRAVEFLAFLTKPIKASQLYNALVQVFSVVQHGNQPSQPIYKSEGAPGETPTFDESLGTRLPLRLLLAEDNSTNQKLAILLLERLGYRTDVAANGLEVLAALKRQDYDVIFMDVQMPEMDGLEATRRIRQEFPDQRQPRIIAMTANAMRGDREICLQAGMNDYIGKPIQVRELVAAIERCNPQKQAQTEQEGSGSAAQNPASRPIVLDSEAFQRLRQTLGKRADQMLPSLLESYFNDAPRLIEEARQALQQGDALALRRAAHTLKSSSATFGAIALSGIAREVETMAVRGELEAAESLLRQLPGAYESAHQALEEAIKDQTV